MDKELDLAVTCYGKVKPLKYDLVLLPWGATEPHNLHLPYLTDCILSHDIALDAAKLAKTHYGIRCMVMPYVTAGSQNPGQRELDFCFKCKNSYRYKTYWGAEEIEKCGCLLDVPCVNFEEKD